MIANPYRKGYVAGNRDWHPVEDAWGRLVIRAPRITRKELNAESSAEDKGYVRGWLDATRGRPRKFVS